MIPRLVVGFCQWVLSNVANLERHMFYLGGKMMIGNILFVLVTILMYVIVIGAILVVVAATVWAVSRIIRKAFAPRKDRLVGSVSN